MTIAAVVAGMQAINLVTPGIKTAPLVPPGGEIADKDLPCVVLHVGRAAWDRQAWGLHRQDREYTHEVYVACIQPIIGKVDTGWLAVEPILEAMGQTYLGNITLDGLIDNILTIYDDGIEELRYGNKGKRYWGFRLHMTAVEK